MVNIAKEDLVRLFEDHLVIIAHDIFKRTRGETFGRIQCNGKTGDNGEINIDMDDNPEFKEAIFNLIGRYVMATISASIDAISTPSLLENTPDEVQSLKKRVARLEAELYKLLPPDFQSPSSESPFFNN